MDKSEPVTRNSLGNRTAWLRPDQKTRAVAGGGATVLRAGMMSSEMVYSSDIYHGSRAQARRDHGALPHACRQLPLFRILVVEQGSYVQLHRDFAGPNGRGHLSPGQSPI